MSTCRLCDRHEVLQKSHIIPAFIFRWLKESSATGHIRFGEQPNRRVQDGYKIPMLCRRCESAFGALETQFSKQVFYPYAENRALGIDYGEWLHDFCVSVSWRVLQMVWERTGLDHCSSEQAANAAAALNAWKSYLKGASTDLLGFEQHLLPLDAVGDVEGGELPANINRYFLRTVDVDFVVGERSGFVYSKLGPMVIIGFAYQANPAEWVGTKVSHAGGRLEPQEYKLPSGFGDYVVGKAEKFANVHQRLSDRQREIINSAAMSNLQRVSTSSSFEAMQHDVGMFGDAAFAIHQKKEENDDG